MGFRGEDFAFGSPAAAVKGMIARLGRTPAARPLESVPLDAARGRVLAESVICDRDSPPFDYSAMDGYAVRAADVAAAVRDAADSDHITLAVVGEARIGLAPPMLPHSREPASHHLGAIRIVTGAAIPEGAGADAVVRREDVTEHVEGRSGQGERVTAISMTLHTAARVHVGDNIRRRGENARAGDTVVEAGTVLTAAALGTLAAVGCVRPRVHPRVRVMVITTGDEVVPPESTPDAYQIRNSNGPAVGAVLASQSWIELASPGAGAITHAGDDGDTLDTALRDALVHADAVVLTGGVSMGHRDPVRAAVEKVGAETIFHGLPQRPGKPMLGALRPREGRSPLLVFGLPGNPVSAMVTCMRIVQPVLTALAGATVEREPRLVPLAKHDGKNLDLWWHRLVRINSVGQAELIDGRGSGDIIAGGRSDGFVEIPPATAAPGPDSARGSPALVPFYPWPM